MSRVMLCKRVVKLVAPGAIGLLCLFAEITLAQTDQTAGSISESGDVQPLEVALEAQSAEPESTVFDLYVSDTYAGSVVATYTEKWFEIEDPSDATAQLTTLKGDLAPITALFTGRIEGRRSVAESGTVYSDLSTFRIILEPNPSFLRAKGLALGQRLGDPEPGLSLQQTMGVAAFNDDAQGSTSAFTHRGLVSSGDVFFRSNGFLAQDEPFQLNEATLGTVVDDYQARAGLLQMHGQSFTPSLRFAGVQFQTAEELFLDNDTARGSRLEIFVPSRSTVKFFRDGQLLAVKVLDFGLQEVDTSAFPQGSYDVDIVITDSAGRDTQERRFFTKAGFLASRTKPTIYLSAGTVRDTLEVLDIPLGELGIRMRASDFFDFSVGVAATDENSIANTELNGLYDVVRVGLSGAVSPNGDRAEAANVGFTLLGVGVYGRVSRADGQDTVSAVVTPIPDVPNFLPQLASQQRDLVIQTQRGTTLSIARSVGPFDMRYNIQRNKVGFDDTRYAAGPSLDWRVISSIGNNVTLRIGDLKTESGSNRIVQGFFRHALNPRWNLEAQLLQRWQDDQDESLGLLGFSHNSLQMASSTGERLQVLEEARRLKNSSSDGKNSTTDSLTSSLIGDLTTDYIRTGAFVRDVRIRGGSESTSVGLNAQSTVFISNTGEVDVAHPPQNDCVFVAELEGNRLSEDDEFDVMVNGQRQGIVSVGERAIVSLTPYRVYKVGLMAKASSSLVDYDAAVHEVTLFPGNVATRVWKVNKVYVLIGRLIDEQGNPISKERVRGAEGYGFTEDDGTFQIEVTGLSKLSVASKRRKCTLDLALTEEPEFYLDVGDVVCRLQGEAESSPESES